MQTRRFTRLTTAFSKKRENLKAAVAVPRTNGIDLAALETARPLWPAQGIDIGRAVSTPA